MTTGFHANWLANNLLKYVLHNLNKLTYMLKFGLYRKLKFHLGYKNYSVNLTC